MVVEEVFAVIAEGTRRDILEALATEHKAVGQLVEELGVSQPTVSKHLRVLREAGVVTMRAQGQKRFYSINTEPLVLVSEWLDGLGAGFVRAPREVSRVVGAGRTPASSTASAGSAAAATSTAPAGVSAQARAAGVEPATTPKAAKSNGANPLVGVPAAAAAQPRVPAVAHLPAVAHIPDGTVPLDSESSVQAQITRSVGRAANKAADLLANLPAFRRRKD
ncbi:hypothetical protein AL755_19935 [Arthrobacter sp. ERGS1:01]|uniref:ArsR/SmtB family transcription factor n=1 Tax=Arthrobacter sp. ERGS1:01 TaxID=1704044 RepID=UPI0006B59849|nr:metalloregulator ArsR/SmtB family transcription factor [Arthrobacter sp. ERGS1:01]ALE07222.1 hypothetical protein AL755_19935 [Arthrobacter sp. ERGS1:01]